MHQEPPGHLDQSVDCTYNGKLCCNTNLDPAFQFCLIGLKKGCYCDLFQRLEKCHGVLTSVISNLSENEAHDALNQMVKVKELLHTCSIIKQLINMHVTCICVKHRQRKIKHRILSFNWKELSSETPFHYIHCRDGFSLNQNSVAQ